MDEEIQALMSGTVGFFWPITVDGNFDSEPERGYIGKSKSGRLEIRTLNENAQDTLFLASKETKPHAIACLFPEGSAVVLNISRRGGMANIGGRKASAYEYSARTAVSRFPVEQLKKGRVNVKVKELTAHFPGVSEWAGMKVSEVKSERKGDGRVKTATVHLKSPEEVVADLGSLSLVIGGHWEVKGNDDRSSIYSPVSIGVKAKRARDISEMLRILVRVQDLVNVAYDTFIPVDGGRAVLGAEGSPAQYPRFWNDALMEEPKVRTNGKAGKGFPLFTLADIDGAQGISRWVRLYERYPSAFDAVATPYRVGGMTWNSYFRDTAVGIERMLAARKQEGRPMWAREKPQSYALAKRLGTPFSDFVGDEKEWAKLFWGVYNGIKHQASYDPDPRDVVTLALSGNLLLTTYLLQRCGMSKSALNRLFNRNVSYLLRDRVQELVQSPPKNLAPNSSY
ncbi:HEPN domain-containing protein [Streptomyces sp. NPDC060184]|uniref:ApeA N-terminal domain 1-containing protein n=1 Tax=Streptomyces sp. NPDC060184 TaxID=3347064 RepID=UPI00364C0BFF